VAEPGLLLAAVLWIGDKLGGAVVSKKFKQRFLKPGTSKSDELLQDVRDTLAFFQRAQERERTLLQQLAKLET
jgi:hypothetical protein